MATDKQDEKVGRRRPLDLLLTVGAVATALTAIVGLVALLWPDPPARLEANLDNLAIDRNVTLSEFSARQSVGDTGTSDRQLGRAPATRRAIVLVANRAGSQARVVAQSLEGGGTESSGPATQPPDPEAPPNTAPGEGQPPTAPEEGDSSAASGADDSSPAESTDSGDPPTRQDGSSEYTSKKIEETIEESPAFGGDCDAEGGQIMCEGGEGGDALGNILPEKDIEEGRGGGAVADAEALLKVLESTRARSVSGRLEPLGVTLSFDLALDGFKDEQAAVRWSLYDAGARKRVPRDWLVNRRALVVRPEATFDRASGEFWVPAPKRKGPFFVRVAVYDNDGERMAFSDSKPFR